MVEWYILFVQTGKEEKVARILQDKLDASLYTVFVPMIETVFRRAGVDNRIINICFPGYVFIESKTSGAEFTQVSTVFIQSIPEAYNILSYDGRDNIAMAEAERLFLRRLLGEINCIEVSTGVIRGEKIIVSAGPLAGSENLIKKINRHKREAKIEIKLMGAVKQLVVGLEIIEKT